MSDKSLETYRWRYARSGRKRKSLLLDEVCSMEGWTRKHAIKVPRWQIRNRARTWITYGIVRTFNSGSSQTRNGLALRKQP